MIPLEGRGDCDLRYAKTQTHGTEEVYSLPGGVGDRGGKDRETRDDPLS